MSRSWSDTHQVIRNLGDLQEFRPVFWWSWNATIEKNEIEKQVGDLKSKGIFEFMVWPTFGLQTPYLSDEFFELMKFTLEKAKQLGMKAWIYDEYNWPSGTAAGRVILDRPEFRFNYLKYVYTEVSDGDVNREVSLKLPEGEPIYVGAVNTDTFDSIDVQGYVREGRLVWDAPDGNWTIVAFVRVFSKTTLPSAQGEAWTTGAQGYIDVLDEEAMSAFIRYTHEIYAKRLGDYFSDVVIGFMNDEPAFHYDLEGYVGAAFGQDQRVLPQKAIEDFEDIDWRDGFAKALDAIITSTVPWSRNFAQRFQEIKGYDVVPRLHDLVIDSPRSIKTRKDFWEVVNTLYSHANFHQLRLWCRRHGLKSIGHLLNEQPVRALLHYEADFFNNCREYHVPGIDHLLCETGFEGATTKYSGPELIGAKLGSSTAHQSGASRSMSESYPCSGWDTTLNDMKRLVDWLGVLGINMTHLECAGPYSFTGFKDHRGPVPSLYYHQPWWRHFKIFSDYVCRLSYLLTNGVHRADVALLFPTSAYWARNVRTELSDPLWSNMETGFNALSEALLRVHLDYDYVFEPSIRQAEIERNRFRVGKELFQTVVIPPTNVLDREILKKLSSFAKAGGLVVAYGLLPQYDTESREVSSLTEAIFNLDPSEVNKLILSSKDFRTRVKVQEVGRGKAIYIQGRPTQVSSKTLEDVIMGIEGLNRDADVRLGDHILKDIAHNHRTLDDCEIYIFANTSGDFIDEAVIRIYEAGQPSLLDLEDGTITSIAYKSRRNRFEIPTSFAPYETLVICLEQNKTEPILRAHAKRGGKPKELLKLDGKWRFRTVDKNMLRLRGWTVKPLGEKYSIETKIFLDYVPSDLSLIFFEGVVSEIEVNGQSVLEPRARRGHWNDPYMLELDASRLFREGENTIAALTDLPGEPRNNWVKSVFPYMLIVGTYSAKNGRICEPIHTLDVGSWTDQGYPEYAGTAVYEKEFTLSKDHLKNRLWLIAGVGRDVLEVYLNGMKAGTRAWSPYSIDISAFVKEGKNKLELAITNTISNLFWCKSPAGVLGEVKIVGET